MFYQLRKSKYNEQYLKELLCEYLSDFDIVIPIHRRPGYHLRHYYRLESATMPGEIYICRVSYIETVKIGPYKFHGFRVEITANGLDWKEI
ncbi:hypothetical protein DOE73_20520 [Paenibacillus dendritiformis]|nr:hypothetical protein DOE73_20520 [Paenibacillus dendritiformis]